MFPCLGETVWSARFLYGMKSSFALPAASPVLK